MTHLSKLVHQLCIGDIPFCIIQKQDREEVLIVTGTNNHYRNISDIQRNKENTHGKKIYDSISVVPFSQIRERGYSAIDEGEEILSINITEQFEVDVEDLKQLLPTDSISLSAEIQYDTTEEQYFDIIEQIIENEIGNGEGANFVIPRNGNTQLNDFTITTALTIFNSLLKNDYGTYWKFIFFDTTRCFIGSTPERHLYVKGGKVKMNPISGTFRKDKNWVKSRDFKKDLLTFLNNPKEINELFMVVDEELKMMAKMCDQGGAIIGPILKEMSQLIHSEYLLAGESDKDIFELFRDSMFAATVVGSPVENSCNIIAKYSNASRRYYGSALMLVGRDEDGRDFLDSPITIRTAEIEPSGHVHFSVGATLVKDSEPKEEFLETIAKSAAIVSALAGENTTVTRPLLPILYNDDDIVETLAQRNQNLSNFWFFRQSDEMTIRNGTENSDQNIVITLIHNGDDFVFMLQHMLNCMGVETKVIRFNRYNIDSDLSDITLLGPGPGNPNEQQIEKITANMKIAKELLNREKKALFICLGHQILCKILGFEIREKERPLQGSQIEVDLFGKKELVGFYNTFAPITGSSSYANDNDTDTATIDELNELIAIRSDKFIGYQFHPESLLTKNGYTILKESVEHLLS